MLERASGTHKHSVQRKAEPTHLHVLCSVPASSSLFYQITNCCVIGSRVSLPLVPCSAAERNGHKHGFCYRGGCPGIEEASICLFAEKKAAKPIFLTVLWPMQPVFILSMPAGYNTLTVFSFSQLRKHLRPAHNHCLPNRNSEWALPLLLNNVQT